MTVRTWDLLVGRDAFAHRQLVQGPSPEAIQLAPEQVLLRVDRFVLSTNNLTYAALGDSYGFWKLFDAPAPFGRVPAWGYAEVVRTAHPDIAVGRRFFGFVPMSSHVVLTAASVSSGIVDITPSRRGVNRAYNYYADAPHRDALQEDREAILRPLALLGFVLKASLIDEAFYGAATVVVSSASSKTAIAFGQMLGAADVRRTVGLTSARNRAFVKRVGAFDEVLGYDEIGALDGRGGAVFMDFAGAPGLAARVRAALGTRLLKSLNLGGTHWAPAGTPGSELRDPIRFSGPDHIQRRVAAWGGATFSDRFEAEFAPVSRAARQWMALRYAAGPNQLVEQYDRLVAGDFDPREGVIVRAAAPASEG